MLLPIEELISREAVNEIRTWLNTGEWLAGKRTAGGIARTAKENLQLNETSELAQKLSQKVLTAVKQNPLFISAVLPHTYFYPRFNCYQNGGHYGLHTDSSILTNDDGQIMRSDVSATLFLSDADEYEGGELTIETPFGAQEIKLNAGDLIIYPSSSLHEVKPVISGARIAAFFWTQSLVKEASQREMLFDLDQSVQTLTAQLGSADEEVRRLNGIYHNLLRQWAQP